MLFNKFVTNPHKIAKTSRRTPSIEGHSFVPSLVVDLPNEAGGCLSFISSVFRRTYFRDDMHRAQQANIFSTLPNRSSQFIFEIMWAQRHNMAQIEKSWHFLRQEMYRACEITFETTGTLLGRHRPGHLFQRVRLFFLPWDT